MIDITKYSDLDIYKIKDVYNRVVKSNLTFFNLDEFTGLLNLIGDKDYLTVDAYKTRHNQEYKIYYKEVL